MRIMTILDALNNHNITFNDFFNSLSEENIGAWQNINSVYMIKLFLDVKIEKLIKVRDEVTQMTLEYPSDCWCLWEEESDIPTPVETKEVLIRSLGLTPKDLEELIYIIKEQDCYEGRV